MTDQATGVASVEPGPLAFRPVPDTADHESEPDEAEAKRWWLRIRRAFGISDILADLTAQILISETLAEANRMDLLPVGDAVITAARELGPAGKLDEAFFDEDQRKHLMSYGKYPDLKWARQVMAERAVAIVRPDGFAQFDVLNVDKVSGVADLLLARVAEHVRSWPFEDTTGRYFRESDLEPPNSHRGQRGDGATL